MTGPLKGKLREKTNRVFTVNPAHVDKRATPSVIDVCFERESTIGTGPVAGRQIRRGLDKEIVRACNQSRVIRIVKHYLNGATI